MRQRKEDLKFKTSLGKVSKTLSQNKIQTKALEARSSGRVLSHHAVGPEFNPQS
jgi:hypothetical protein